MPTKTIAVKAGQDVASVGWDTDHWYFIVDPADCDIGWVSNAINRQGNTLRFLNVPIPPGSTILYAYLKYCAFSNYAGDSVYAYIRAEKSLSPQPFTTYADYIARPRTTNKADWSEIHHWLVNMWYNSIDFTNVIQEVINQPGWAQGNPIAVFCNDHDDRSSHFDFCMRHGKAYHIAPAKAPQLHLSYLLSGEEPPPPSPSAHYLIGGDAYQRITPTTTAGQTFRPVDDHILAYIDFNIDIFLPITRPYIRVYEALPDGSPDGWNISEGAFFYFPTKDLTGKWRVRVPMQPVLLEKNKLYLIELKCWASIFEKLRWQYDKGDATYFLRGWRMLKNEITDIWTPHYDDCHIFAEFGTPPLPKPDPPPPITNFATLNIFFIHAPDYIMIFLHTGTPCHLTLYHTDKPPRKHHTSRIVRGLEVPWATYFCFVAWQAVEQLEAGDTLWHTFVVAPWEYCQIKWFTFRGEVNDFLSPSVGPIFTHHHSGAEPGLFEHYIINDDDEKAIFDRHWRGQTFTPSISHNITSVKLLLRRVLLPGQVTVSIRAATYGKPIGPDLCSGTFDGNTLTTDGAGEWKEITFDIHPLLDASTTYAIVIRAIAGDGSNNLRWRDDNSYPAYPGGLYVYSEWSGTDWTRVYGTDMMFEEWGIAI